MTLSNSQIRARSKDTKWDSKLIAPKPVVVVHTPNLNAQESGAGGLKVHPGLQSETVSHNSIVVERNQINPFMPWVLSIRLQGSDSQRLREIHQGKLVERRSLFFETRTANQAGGIQTADVKKQKTGPSETEGAANSRDQSKLPCLQG